MDRLALVKLLPSSLQLENSLAMISTHKGKALAISLYSKI